MQTRYLGRFSVSRGGWKIAHTPSPVPSRAEPTKTPTTRVSLFREPQPLLLSCQSLSRCSKITADFRNAADAATRTKES
jgi:hypothetical protein